MIIFKKIGLIIGCCIFALWGVLTPFNISVCFENGSIVGVVQGIGFEVFSIWLFFKAVERIENLK